VVQRLIKYWCVWLASKASATSCLTGTRLAKKTATPSGTSWSPLCLSTSCSRSRGPLAAVVADAKARSRVATLLPGLPSRTRKRLAKPGRCGDANGRTAHTEKGRGSASENPAAGLSPLGESGVNAPAQTPGLATATIGRLVRDSYVAETRVSGVCLSRPDLSR
jgi:hypothetical protein